MVLRIPHGWGWLPFLLSVVRHQDWEFDGEIEDLGLPWSPERLELIKRGEADPTEEELHQWRPSRVPQTGPRWVLVRVDNAIDDRGEDSRLCSFVPSRSIGSPGSLSAPTLSAN